MVNHYSLCLFRSPAACRFHHKYRRSRVEEDLVQKALEDGGDLHQMGKEKTRTSASSISSGIP